MTDKSEIILEIKNEFRRYITNNHSQINSIDTLIVDAFYPYRHDVGIDFWEILKNEESFIRYKNLLEVYLRDVINRKSPINHANSYLSIIRKLKEFFDIEYGGVDQYLLKKQIYLKKDERWLDSKIYNKRKSKN